MAAYNGVNGATDDREHLLAEPLKGEWGFDGVIVSDWGAPTTASRRPAPRWTSRCPARTEKWAGRWVIRLNIGMVPTNLSRNLDWPGCRAMLQFYHA